MRYIAELYNHKGGERCSFDTADISASDDLEAGRKAQEWAVPIISQMIDRIVHLQVVQDGRGVFSKDYGEL